MRNEQTFQDGNNFNVDLSGMNLNLSRKATIGIILAVALLAFEMFNFDTTQYALRNLLGDVRFLGLQWASILAIAFCSIDFAGLARLFTPEKGADEPKEVWYLMGAWFLGATMNAAMTWWAVSLTLLSHDFGNEVLSEETLLRVVPVFIAVLVLLTRILFIGAFTVAGEHIFDFSRSALGRESRPQPAARPMGMPKREPTRRSPQAQVSVSTPHTNESPSFLDEDRPAQRSRPKRQNSRVRQRPPMPNGGIRRVPPSGVQARSRNQH
jgi:hypothetical protein